MAGVNAISKDNSTIQQYAYLSVVINDFTQDLRAYCTAKYILKYITYVPESDLAGIKNIDICDYVPERWAFGQSGGYFTAEDNALEGVVHIYIDNSLLFITTFQPSTVALDKYVIKYLCCYLVGYS